MKIVVVGGTGNVGARVVEKLIAHGHEAVSASRRDGVNSYTGEGLEDAFAGAHVVVDTTQAPSYKDDEVLDFFTKSTANQLAAAKAAGVTKHVALTIVGTNRPNEIGYFHGRAAQEKLIRESGLDYTLVHATQFHEFVQAVVFTGTQGDEILVSDGLVQPIAADDVATAVARAAAHDAAGDIEVAGPEAFPLAEYVQRFLDAKGDSRVVIEKHENPYFGAVIDKGAIVPVEGAKLFEGSYGDWLAAL